MTKKCIHGNQICAKCVVVTDAGKKISDAIRLALVFKSFEETSHGWMAFRLHNGDTDHTVYPTKRAAIDHQLGDEKWYCYFYLGRAMGGVTPQDAQLWLDFQRYIYDSGASLREPDVDVMMPLARGRGYFG